MTDQQEWPFDQAPNVAAMTTGQVLELGYPIRYVLHYDHDDSWAFLCGTTKEFNDYRVIHMSHALELDDFLRQVADLPTGWSAWREDDQSPWERFQKDLNAE